MAISVGPYIGINVDLSQAESRVIDHILFHLTQNEHYLWRALVRPADYDQHTDRASVLFKTPAKDITKLQRYLGKKTVHAYQRGMGAETFQDTLLKDSGTVMTREECRDLLKEMDKAEPDIKGVYFPWVRQQIITHRRLINSWGRRIIFTYDRFDDALYRRGYSFYPQGEVADWMNQKGLIPFYQLMQARGWRHEGKVKLNVHGHDSLFFSAVPEVAYAATEALVTMLEQKRMMYGRYLTIPCEVEIGKTWQKEAGWKQLPGREEFEEKMWEVLAC